MNAYNTFSNGSFLLFVTFDFMLGVTAKYKFTSTELISSVEFKQILLFHYDTEYMENRMKGVRE